MKQTDLLIKELQNVKALLKEKDKKIDDLENRVEQLEQYTRMEDVVISRLETTHRTYARATSGNNEGEDAPQGELLTLEKQVINFYTSKNISIESTAIAACHTIPQRRATKQKIIMRFVNRKDKIELLKEARKLKGTGIFVNEHLTRKNADCLESKSLEKGEKDTRHMDKELQSNGKAQRITRTSQGSHHKTSVGTGSIQMNLDFQ